MLVTRTNPNTQETVTQSIAVTTEILNMVRMDIISEEKKAIQFGKLSHLTVREVKFLYKGILDPLAGTPEQRYHQLTTKE